MSIGVRMRQYRTARGYTLDELAERMGGVVTKQALSKYEHDAAMPRPTVLVAMARALDVKAARLAGEPAYRFEVVGFRALTALPKAEQESIANRVEIELERRMDLADRLGVVVPFPFERTFKVGDVSAAEHAAGELREAWDLGGGPIANVVDTLESRGVHLFEVQTDRKFDGLAIVARDESGHRVACGVAARAETSRGRQRMSHAHEVGHLAVATAEGIDAELAARRFGGAFLFPASAVVDQFGAHRRRITAEELVVAKQRWGMSVQALLYRLHDLEILDDAGYKWWCMYVNKAGWRTAEPGDEAPERSIWNEAHAYRAAAEGLIGREQLAEYVPAVRDRAARFPGDIDRRALMRLPVAERREIMRAHAESIAEQYNHDLDGAWLDADLGEWDAGDE
jgi:transcriptional regulator with XRE-family HTH domain/Zn-dependent peptidase ImmA (M78 family)